MNMTTCAPERNPFELSDHDPRFRQCARLIEDINVRLADHTRQRDAAQRFREAAALVADGCTILERYAEARRAIG